MRRWVKEKEMDSVFFKMCNLVIIYAMFFPKKFFFFVNKSVSLLLQGKEKKELEKQQRVKKWPGSPELLFFLDKIILDQNRRQFETTSKSHFHQEEWQRIDDLIIKMLARVLRNHLYTLMQRKPGHSLQGNWAKTLFKRHILLGTHTLDTRAPMHKVKQKGMSLKDCKPKHSPGRNCLNYLTLCSQKNSVGVYI